MPRLPLVRNAPFPDGSNMTYVKTVTNGDRPGTMGMLPPQASEQAYLDQKQNGREVEKQHCFDFYRKKQSIRPFFLTTTVNPVPIAAGVGQTAVATLDIGQEADFNVQKIACLVSRAGGAPARQDDFTFRIIDTRKGVAMSNVQIHNLCGTGTGLFPFILPDPYWFPRASSIQIEMTNRTAVALNVFWSFTGFELLLPRIREPHKHSKLGAVVCWGKAILRCVTAQVSKPSLPRP